MAAHVVVQRADDREFVGDLGLQGEVFADVHARNVCGDGSELAAGCRGCVGLEIVGFQLRGATMLIEHDDGGSF